MSKHLFGSQTTEASLVTFVIRSRSERSISLARRESEGSLARSRKIAYPYRLVNRPTRKYTLTDTAVYVRPVFGLSYFTFGKCASVMSAAVAVIYAKSE